MFLPDPNRDTRLYNNVTHLNSNKDFQTVVLLRVFNESIWLQNRASRMEGEFNTLNAYIMIIIAMFYFYKDSFIPNRISHSCWDLFLFHCSASEQNEVLFILIL